MPIFDFYHIPYPSKTEKNVFENKEAGRQMVKAPATDKFLSTFMSRKISPANHENVPRSKLSPAQKQQQQKHKQQSKMLNQQQQQQQLFHHQPSPYARLVQRLSRDERMVQELAQERRVGLYRFYGNIGLGNFSQVKLAVHQLTQERVAAKIISKCQLDTKTENMLSREILNMQLLHHPNIIRLYEVVETPHKIYLILEHAPGGELFHKISSQGHLSEASACSIMCQLVSAVTHMHSKGVFHRDIKAENVLFVGPNVVKLGDLGFSTHVFASEQKLNTFCGSPPYAAPELFCDDHYLGAGVDTWALGVLLYFMIEGVMPFRGVTVAALKRQIIDGTYPAPRRGISQECCALIKGMLCHNPVKRLSLSQVKESDWLRQEPWPDPWPAFQLTSANSTSKKFSSPSTLSSTNSVVTICESKKHNIEPIQVIGDPVTCDEVTSVLEQSARRRLQQLGIDRLLLETSWLQSGCRSAVVGVYRIMLHRLMRIEAGELVETGSPVRSSSMIGFSPQKLKDLSPQKLSDLGLSVGSKTDSPSDLNRFHMTCSKNNDRFTAPLSPISGQIAIRNLSSTKDSRYGICAIL